MTGRTIVLGILLLAGLAMAWVRLAPSDPARWHSDPAQGSAGSGGHVAQVVSPDTPATALAALDQIAMADPRTVRLAGSPEEGRITYVSRSRVFGFPDYTTVGAVAGNGGTTLTIHARQRFGQSDLGVNAARVGRWLAALPGLSGGAPGAGGAGGA